MASPKFRLRTDPFISLLRAAVLFGVAVGASSSLPVITKDVVVLGGGASGTYAAVRLQEDYNKSVLLIEKEPVLVGAQSVRNIWSPCLRWVQGGHTNTYDIPDTGVAINYGVLTYVDYMGAKAFFERLNISTQPLELVTANQTLYVDPDTGEIVPNDDPAPPLDDSVDAIERYGAIIEPWQDYLLPGYWNFPPGDEIPEDLLLDFPDFIAKYNLSAAAPVFAFVAGINVNSVRPTLYSVMNFGTPIVEGYLDNTFFNPDPWDNSLIYTNSQLLLGDAVKLNTEIVNSTRSDEGVRLIIKDHQTGAETLVLAKRLIVTSRSPVQDLAALDFDEEETEVFSTFGNGTTYTAVLKTNIIPDNTDISFVVSANSTAAPRTYHYSLTWTGNSGYVTLIISSSQAMTADEAKDAIEADMKVLADGGAFPSTNGEAPSSEVVAVSDHSGIGWDQSADLLSAGFMQKFYGIQGHRGTWYTGGLWCPDFSSNVWAFTDSMLPRMLEEMD